MAHHSPRRKSSLSPFTLFLIFFTFASTASAASAVLGIDLGTEYIKAALVKPGVPLDIVLTKDSKRKEISAVAFKPLRSGGPDDFPERLYGSDAVVLGARFPGDMYPNLKPLLGQILETSDVAKEYQIRQPALKLEADKTRGTVAFKSQVFGEEAEPYMVEELLAMELQNVRSNAEAMAGKGSRIRDAVITIPAFYTAEERRAIELAADLAGIRLLGLVTDGLAVGINYATSRTFPSVSEGGKPEHHVIFDMGAGSTKATVLKFQGKTVKDVGRFNKTIQEVSVLGAGWDRTLGGDALNEAILNDIVESFSNLPKVRKAGLKESALESARKNGRTAAKLWKESERVRQVLSANSETVASFESLYKDIDFRYKISRAEFEKLTEFFAARVAAPVKQALKAAKLDLVDIDSVILHGGAARTPFVQRELEKLIGSSSKLRTNVNADEAAVFGAAFQGASLSPSFRVKQIRTNDAAGYAAGVKWASDEKDRQQKLFQPTSFIGADKSVPFKKQDDFTFSLYQQLPSGDEIRDFAVANIKTNNLTESFSKLVDSHGCSRTEIVTKFSIRLNPINGLPEVAGGSVSCETEPSTEKKGGVVEDVKGFFGFGGKKSDQEPLKSDDDTSSKTTSESETKSSTSSSTTASSSAESKKDKKPKKRLQLIPINITSTSEGLPVLPEAELTRIRERLAAFDSSDADRRKREEILNTLEALTYKYRDLATEKAFTEYSTSEELKELESQLSTLSDWLYGDGADADKATLKARLKEFKGLVGPIETRRTESAKRPKQIELFDEAVGKAKEIIKLVQSGAEKAAEASSSAAEAASSSETTSATTTSSSAATTSGDDFADLEDESSTTTSKETTPPKPPTPPDFTFDDVKAMNAKLEVIENWYSEKSKAQADLKASEDPALLVADLEAKMRELNSLGIDVIMRKQKQRAKPKKPKAKKTKTKTTTTTVADGEETPSSTLSAAQQSITLDVGPDGMPSEEQIEEAIRKASGGGNEQKPHDEL